VIALLDSLEAGGSELVLHLFGAEEERKGSPARRRGARDLRAACRPG